MLCAIFKLSCIYIALTFYRHLFACCLLYIRRLQCICDFKCTHVQCACAMYNVNRKCCYLLINSETVYCGAVTVGEGSNTVSTERVVS